MRSVSKLWPAVLVSSLVGCGGGGGGGGGGPTPQPNASIGGIWKGTDSISGLPVIGLAAETGQFHFIRQDGVQYYGTGTTSGNAVTANFTGVTPLGTAFPDGSTYGTGTLSGTVSERSTLSGSTSFRTAAGNSDSGNVTLTYNALYDRDSSLTTIAGNFTDVKTGDVVSVSASGVIFEQDPATGCVVNGNVGIIDSRYDAYSVQWTYSSCTGANAVLNGLTFNGIGTLDNTVTPEQAIVGVTATTGTTGYAVVLVLQRT